ncbi:hypothetical protein Tco_0714151 [Tanacetum coccineum]
MVRCRICRSPGVIKTSWTPGVSFVVLKETINELQETIAHYRAQETNVENHVEAIAHYPAHAPNLENHADYQREARRMKILLVLNDLVVHLVLEQPSSELLQALEKQTLSLKVITYLQLTL